MWGGRGLEGAGVTICPSLLGATMTPSGSSKFNLKFRMRTGPSRRRSNDSNRDASLLVTSRWQIMDWVLFAESTATDVNACHVWIAMHEEGAADHFLHTHVFTMARNQAGVLDWRHLILLSGPCLANNFTNLFWGNWNHFNPVVNGFLVKTNYFALEILPGRLTTVARRHWCFSLPVRTSLIL